MSTIKHPWAPMQTQVLTAGATIAATVNNPCILQIGSAALDAGFTLNLTAGASLQAGDVVMISWLSDGTARSMTPGTLFKGTTAVTGTISKTQTVLCVYDGSALHKVSSLVQ